MRVVLNPLASREPYSLEEATIVSRGLAEVALQEVVAWEGYRPTPLRSLRALARNAGVSDVFYKDESGRFGQGSFKILGGAYAATMMLLNRENPQRETLCCATDGNHGRSVAYAAQRFGCDCVVFMHENASAYKEAAIAALGASVVRVQGTYDDAIRHARQTALEAGWLLISDTSDNEADPITRLVMQGYGVMVLELLEQLSLLHASPTHVVLQGGVGGLAASVAGLLSEAYGARRPVVILVEPQKAACLLESVLHGARATVAGDLITAMEMLSAGEVSPVAWPILRRRADVFIAIDDTAALATAHRLSTGEVDGTALDVGVSGAAGVAGLLELLKNPELASLLRLDQSARVLAFGTEESLYRSRHR